MAWSTVHWSPSKDELDLTADLSSPVPCCKGGQKRVAQSIGDLKAQQKKKKKMDGKNEKPNTEELKAICDGKIIENDDGDDDDGVIENVNGIEDLKLDKESKVTREPKTKCEIKSTKTVDGETQCVPYASKNGDGQTECVSKASKKVDGETECVSKASKKVDGEAKSVFKASKKAGGETKYVSKVVKNVDGKTKCVSKASKNVNGKEKNKKGDEKNAFNGLDETSIKKKMEVSTNS